MTPTTPPPEQVAVTEALLPCPFCGSAPTSFPSGDGSGTMIECITPGCVAPHVSYYGDGEAARRWNTRLSALATQQPGREELKQLAHDAVHQWLEVLFEADPDRMSIEGIECAVEQIADALAHPAASQEPSEVERDTIERCAQLADRAEEMMRAQGSLSGDKQFEGGWTVAKEIADAIRALSPAERGEG